MKNTLHIALFLLLACMTASFCSCKHEAKKEALICSAQNTPVDPFKALYQMKEPADRSPYVTRRFAAYSYYQADWDVIYFTQDEYRPDSIPVIIKSPESDFVYSVAWNQGEWPMGGTFIVALEDGLWKIDNLLSPAETESESKADSQKRKFSPLFDYSQPVQDNLCFDPEAYEFTEERLADAASVPEYVPEIP